MTPSFIVLEGPDGSGTSLHSRLLAERLQREGHDVLLTTEPSDSAIGIWIRTLLKEKTTMDPAALQLLFCADRADHIATVIKPAIAAGKTVICDRYAPSTLIYGDVLGLDVDWLEDINAQFVQPDVTLFTLPPFEVCQERLSRRDERDLFEGTDFQRRIYEAYEKYVAEDQAVIVVDTSGEKAAVADEIFEKIRNSKH